nr:MAG TPA: Mitochondrial import receptor subunit Tom6, fungal [Caudoviricetes sp.]
MGNNHNSEDRTILISLAICVAAVVFCVIRMLILLGA